MAFIATLHKDMDEHKKGFIAVYKIRLLLKMKCIRQQNLKVQRTVEAY